MLLGLLGLLWISSAQASHVGFQGMPAPGVYLNSEGSPLIPLLQQAQRSIDIEIYTMQDPEVRSLLRSALSRNVQIRVIQDGSPAGASCDVFSNSAPSAQVDAADCEDQRKLVAEVRSSGGTYIPFDKQNLCPNGGNPGGHGCFQHGKIAVVDRQISLISTGNFDATNLCIVSENPSRCDRDWSVIVNDGTVVQTLEALYEADLKGVSYDVRTLIPASLQGILIVSPYALQPLVDFVNTATRTIDIETQYLRDPVFNAALIAAAKRGVQVNVTVSSACAFGKPKNSDVTEFTKVYSAFDKAGISSSMFNSSNRINGHSGYMHAKVIIVDGQTGWIGSTNGSTTSMTENREYGVIFESAVGVQKALSVTRADHDSPDSESWTDSLNCAKDGGGQAGGPSPEPLDPTPKPKRKSHKKKPSGA